MRLIGTVSDIRFYHHLKIKIFIFISISSLFIAFLLITLYSFLLSAISPLPGFTEDIFSRDHQANPGPLYCDDIAHDIICKNNMI
jgi:hypothetical protein